jgi:hypothetical protein
MYTFRLFFLSSHDFRICLVAFLKSEQFRPLLSFLTSTTFHTDNSTSLSYKSTDTPSVVSKSSSVTVVTCQVSLSSAPVRCPEPLSPEEYPFDHSSSFLLHFFFLVRRLELLGVSNRRTEDPGPGCIIKKRAVFCSIYSKFLQ